MVAGVVEIYRKDDLSTTGGRSQVLAGQTFNASTLSVFLQVPQFALVGAGEVFTSISGMYTCMIITEKGSKEHVCYSEFQLSNVLEFSKLFLQEPQWCCFYGFSNSIR